MPQPIATLSGRGMPLLLDDIDTDRIIPARFLRCVTFDGLGEHAFEDDRQQDKQHPFDDPRFQEGKILVAGRNFGCGSSREHAPQALLRWGIQAIVAESFAEIFFGNCTSMGVPCLCARRGDLERLSQTIIAKPQATITVDLVAGRIKLEDIDAAVAMPDGARQSLVTGNRHFLGQLLEGSAAVKQATAKIPYLAGFRA